MKMYKTFNFSDEIKEVEVLRKTESSVWEVFEFRGKKTENRSLINTRYYKYWDSFDDAKNYLIEKYERKISVLKNNLSDAEKSLIDLKKRNQK